MLKNIRHFLFDAENKCIQLIKLATFIFINLYSTNTLADLEIIHFNVGMGDSTLLIDTKTNESILVDAGNRGKGRSVIYPELKKLKQLKINYFIATHYDADHIGGFNELIENGIEFDVVYDRGEFTNRTLKTVRDNETQYGEYVRTSYGKRKTIDSIKSCKPIVIGDTKVWFVASAGKYVKSMNPCTSDFIKIPKRLDNDLSIGLLVKHKSFQYFIGGDLTGGGKNTKDMEGQISTLIGDIDVLKVNHHGSSSSSNNKFLSSLSPEAVVISVGNGGVNRSIYHLPTQEVLTRIDNLDTKPSVYLTNRGEGGSSVNGRVVNGHVVVRTNGLYYWVNNDIYNVDEML